MYSLTNKSCLHTVVKNTSRAGKMNVNLFSLRKKKKKRKEKEKRTNKRKKPAMQIFVYKIVFIEGRVIFLACYGYVQ